MVRKVQCSICKNKFSKEDLIQVTKSKKVCKSCQEIKVKESREYTDLIKFICDGFRLPAPTGQQLKSIKKFKESGFRYLDIHQTLYFVFCIKNKKPVGTSIELMPYYFEEAKKHFKIVENVKKNKGKIEKEPIIIYKKKGVKKSINRTRYVDLNNV